MSLSGFNRVTIASHRVVILRKSECNRKRWKDFWAATKLSFAVRRRRPSEKAWLPGITLLPAADHGMALFAGQAIPVAAALSLGTVRKTTIFSDTLS